MKCIVKDCQNQGNKGEFIGELCVPCHEFITQGKGVHSQIYRNFIKIAKREVREEVRKDIVYSINDIFAMLDTK